jgi:hypothetical protein
MTEASTYLLEMAKCNADAYIALPQTRAAMVTGSVAECLSDFYSDIDMTIYYEELPSEEELASARLKNQGSERIWLLGDREQGGFAEAYNVQGVECQIGHHGATGGPIFTSEGALRNPGLPTTLWRSLDSAVERQGRRLS